jgi:hypothetical protein
LFWTVVDHILFGAPDRELKWCRDWMGLHFPGGQPDEQAKQFAAALRMEPAELHREMIQETEPKFDHARPYRWYLPYCLINYVVYAASLLTLCMFAILADQRRMVEERRSLDRVLLNQKLRDFDIDREFARFFDVSFRHTRRYVSLLLWVSIVIFYESLVTRYTLSDVGWRYEILTSSVVGLTALLWVGILLHFYEGAFQRCRNEKRRRNRLSDKWERSWNSTHFLIKCFLNLRTGVAFGIYLIPNLLLISEAAFR